MCRSQINTLQHHLGTEQIPMWLCFNPTIGSTEPALCLGGTLLISKLLFHVCDFTYKKWQLEIKPPK